MDSILREETEPPVPSDRSSLNSRNITTQGHLRKRSLGGECLRADTQTFDVTVLSSKQRGQIFSFVPCLSILRAHLPLSWLSSHPNGPGLHTGAIVQATLDTLSRWDYHVFVAKLTTTRDFYAIEKIDFDTYLCHPLNSWVRLQWIEQAAVGAAPTVSLEVLLQSQNDMKHQRNPSISSINGVVSGLSTPTSPKILQNRRGQFARRSILEARKLTEEPQSLPTKLKTHDVSEAAAYPQTQITTDIQNADMTPVLNKPPPPAVSAKARVVESRNASDQEKECAIIQPSPVADQLSVDYLRRQYLETLYLSKTSLAFYAKGPLSRARARVRVPHASRTVEQLIDFYRDSILPRKRIDSKYKDTMQGQIAGLTSCETTNADDEETHRKKTRRTKLGKDGLWPCEVEFITRWWKEREIDPGTSSDIPNQTAEMQKHITQLRMRETELQIILILEILALEAREVVKVQLAAATTEQDIKIESVEHDEEIAVTKIAPAKKPRDLRPELDFLVDRMCIWHSIGLEDSESGLGRGPSGSTSSKMKDRLRDFCTDVIVPFYGGKLPEQCQMICNKMGGPEVSPRRSKNVSEKQARPVKPGEAAPGSLSKKRSLDKVHSKDQGTRRFSPPSLSRSSTLPVSMALKRESSERPASRSGLQKSVSFSNREVDLEGDARITAAKRRKLDLVAAQKRELNAAIEALKRPSRSVVAKNFMDDVEERATKSTMITKKIEPIQISATPKRGGARYSQPDDFDLPPMPNISATQEQTSIPSSALRPRGTHLFSEISRSSAKKRAVLSAIHDTPSRSTLHRAEECGFWHEAGVDSGRGNPDVTASMATASTPTISRTRHEPLNNVAATPLRMNKSQKQVVLTPLQKSNVSIEKAFRDIPEIPELAGKMMDRAMGSKTDMAEISIYDSLGWNDDDDDL